MRLAIVCGAFGVKTSGAQPFTTSASRSSVSRRALAGRDTSLTRRDVWAPDNRRATNGFGSATSRAIARCGISVSP